MRVSAPSTILFKRLWLSVGPLLLGLTALLPANAQAEKATALGADHSDETLVDRIVAVVDGHPILYSEVKTKVDKGPLVVVSEFPLEDSAPAYDRALQDSINFELVLTKAKDLEIDVRDDEVEGEIKSFLETRNLSRDGLLEHLGQSGMTYADYKRDFRDQMILRKFQGRVIRPLVKVTDRDIETYYMKKAGNTADLVEFVLRQLLIAVPAGASDEVMAAKQKLAGDVYQKLKNGMAFPEAVKIYSDDTSARESGGLMSPVHIKDLAPAIGKAVEALEVNQFSEPLKTTAGFYLFFLQDKKFSGSQDFLAKKRQLENELFTDELMEQTRHWISEQRQKTKVEIVPNN